MPESITCPRCGRTSHHPEDRAHQYCAACHQFHDEMEEDTTMRWRRDRSQRHPPPGPPDGPPTVQLTPDESLCVLSAVITQLGQFGHSEDPEDRESAAQLREAAQKLRRMLGMDDQTFFQFCAFAAGKPAEGTVKLFQELDEAKQQEKDEERRRRAGIPGGLGATGAFPEGSIDESDEGELRLAIGSDPERQIVQIEFGKPVAWLGLPPEDAREMARSLLRHAEHLDRTLPRTE